MARELMLMNAPRIESKLLYHCKLVLVYLVSSSLVPVCLLLYLSIGDCLKIFGIDGELLLTRNFPGALQRFCFGSVTHIRVSLSLMMQYYPEVPRPGTHFMMPTV